MDIQDTQGLMGAGMDDPAAQGAAAPQQDQSQPMMQDQAAGTQPQGSQGQVDVQPILNGIQVPANLKPMYDKIVLAGMRIMFSKGSHQLLADQLQKQGPLDDKISQGIVGLMYMLWTQSNKSIPPQLMIPATVALTVRAFDYVQKTGDPQATKEVLGSSIEKSINLVMNGFGAKLDDLQNTLQKSKVVGGAAVGALKNMDQQGAQPQQGGGLMDATGEQNG